MTLAEVLMLHHMLLDQTGGASGVRDLGALEAALGQPRQSFGGADLYPDISDKAAALGFSLIQNHPFVDGNKRAGHAAMEMFLVHNGHELSASVDDAEEMIVAVAAGRADRKALTAWVSSHIQQLRS